MSKLSAGAKRRIKGRMCEEKPTVWIGKGHVSKEIVEEIEKQLDKREVVKVKVLRTALNEGEVKEIASNVSAQTESTLVEVRGHTFVLYKHRRRGNKK
ncbi:MAG: YhbY family RNA-binding protein [Candidatus Bathyarchaeia archaeon]